MKAQATMKRVAAILAMALVLSSCSTVRGWFGKNSNNEAKKADKPAELVDFKPSLKVSKVWSASVGDGEKRLGLEQKPAVADGHVYAAAADNSVYALDLQNGREIWRYRAEKRRADIDPDVQAALEEKAPEDRKETKAEKAQRKQARKLAKKRAKEKIEWRFSGGPGAGDGLVVVGTLDGQVIALNATDGTEKWQAKVPNEVIAAPAVGQGYVLVRSNDGTVTAFDAASGERRWFANREMPSLTVRGNASLTLGPGVAFSGNDDGTVTALSLSDGHQLWEQVVGEPEGRSELERMTDVDGAPVLDGTTLYATSYKKQTLAIDGPSGRPLWTRDNGGVGGLGLAANSVVVADPGGVVWALDRSSGGALWSNPTMVRRSLTAPAVQGDYAVVADYNGYVHWLKMDTGEVAARERVGRKPVKAQPVVADGLLLVENTEGKLTAFRLQ